jgi:diguanylate cyclase (GGDEF)-like protein
LPGIDTAGLTLMAWSLGALTVLVVALMVVAAFGMRRALHARDARIEQLTRDGKLAQEQAAHALDLATRRAQANEARVEQLLAAGQLGSFEWDLVSGRLATDPGFAAQLGYGAHELAPHFDAWLRLAHPEDAPRLAALRELAAERGELELRLRHAGGAWQWMRVAARVAERDAASGAALRLVGLQQGIAAERRALEALEAERALLEGGPVLAIALDAAPPHALREAGESLQRARGCRAGEPVPIGASLNDLMHRDDAAALRQAIEQAKLAQDPRGAPLQREVRLLHASGRWCWFLLHLKADPGARLLRGFLIDIERLKQAESQAAAHSAGLQGAVQKMSATQRFLQSVQQMTELLQLSESEADGRDIVAQAGPELFPRWPGAVSFAGDKGQMEIAARWGGIEMPGSPCAETDCWAVRRGRLHLSSRAPAGTSGLQPVCAHFGRSLPPGVTHAICAPLFTSSERAGALHLVTAETLAEDEVRSAVWGAETVADALKLSLANLRLRLSLREQAVRDWMTGLYNRRYFEEVLRHELSRSERAHESVTLALFDIDHFKSFNDRFGHEAGDEVLKAVATQLLNFVRSYDIACRVGGEELALLLPRAHLQETCSRLDQLRERIARAQLDHAGNPLPQVTVSIGVAALGEGTGVDILRRADVALYAAKHGGRNRLMCWTPELEKETFFGSFDDSQRVVSVAK